MLRQQVHLLRCLIAVALLPAGSSPDAQQWLLSRRPEE